MKTVGIICEYNPFHLGHQRQFRLIRAALGEETALVCVMSGDFVQRGASQARALSVLHGLEGSLDFEQGGEIADRLNAIYLYSRRTLGEARIQKSPEKIEHVQGLIREIRESWAQICGGAEV